MSVGGAVRHLTFRRFPFTVGFCSLCYMAKWQQQKLCPSGGVSKSVLRVDGSPWTHIPRAAGSLPFTSTISAEPRCSSFFHSLKLNQSRRLFDSLLVFFSDWVPETRWTGSVLTNTLKAATLWTECSIFYELESCGSINVTFSDGLEPWSLDKIEQKQLVHN